MTTVELKPLQAIVLAFSIQRRLYGYEIVDLVEQSVCSTVLKPTRTAAYNALRRLQQLGCVTSDIEDATQRQRVTKRRWDDHRRWYRATPTGLHAYQQWVTRKLDDEPERAGVLVRIAIAARLGTPALRKILHECEELSNAREETLQAVPTPNSCPTGIDALCNRLVIAERRLALRGIREWIGAARHEIDAYERQQEPVGPDRSSRCGKLLRPAGSCDPEKAR